MLLSKTSLWTQGLLLQLLCSLAAGKAVDSRLIPQLDVVSLHPRVELSLVDPILSNQCVYLCDISTGCGRGASSCPIFGKRDELRTSTPRALSYKLWNETSQGHSEVSAEEYYAELSVRSDLVKRTWKTDYRWTKKRIAEYLPQQVGEVGQPEAQFGDGDWLTSLAGNMATVSFQKRLDPAEGPFQLASPGIHGCTVMAIISRRAVYMVHYWEIYALNGDDDLTAGSEAFSKFQANVEYSILGDQRKDPITEGPGVDWSLFNQPRDNTRILFMTPYEDGFRMTSSTYKTQMKDLKYTKKIQYIINLLNRPNRIPGAAVVVQGYQRLNWSWDRQLEKPTGEDADIVDKTERGIACFQYDGDKQYRLFFEHIVYQNSDKIAG